MLIQPKSIISGRAGVTLKSSKVYEAVPHEKANCLLVTVSPELAVIVRRKDVHIIKDDSAPTKKPDITNVSVKTSYVKWLKSQDMARNPSDWVGLDESQRQDRINRLINDVLAEHKSGWQQLRD